MGGGTLHAFLGLTGGTAILGSEGDRGGHPERRKERPMVDHQDFSGDAARNHVTSVGIRPIRSSSVIIKFSSGPASGFRPF